MALPDFIPDSQVSSSAGGLPDFIPDGQVTSTDTFGDTMKGLSGISDGFFKGASKATLLPITAPADLIYRGGNYLANKITGNEVDPKEFYPSNVSNWLVDKLFDAGKIAPSNDTAEVVGNVGGTIMTGLGLPSLAAKASAATKATPIFQALSKTPYIAPAVKAATAIIPSAIEGAGYGVLGNAKGEDLVGQAETGAMIGGAIPVVQKGLEVGGNILGSLKNSIYNTLVGNKPTANALPIALDEAGQRAASVAEATRQASKQDINTETLEKAGFFDKLGFFNSPKTAALKLAQEIEPAGKELAKVTGQIAEKEAALVESGAPWAKNIVEQGPDLSGPLSFARTLKKQLAAGAEGSVKKVRNIQSQWENSDKSFEALRQIQKDFGKTFKASFKPTTTAESNMHDLNKQIYASLKRAISDRVEAIAPELSKDFKAANDLFSAASSLATPAFNAARKGGQGIPVVSKIPGAAIAIKTAKDLSAVPSAKLLKGAESLATTLSKANLTPGAVASIAKSFEDAPSQPFSTKIDKAMTKAEDKLATPEAALEAPKVISAKRLPSKLTPDQAHLLVPAVIAQESGGKADAVSDVGAQGLMQLMPETGKELFKKAGLKGKYKPFDPEQNIQLGTMYLKDLLEQFDGNAPLALTAYHSGPGRVKNLLKIHNADSLEQIRKYLGPVGQKYADQTLARLKKLGIESV